jgi:hypothetical protein
MAPKSKATATTHSTKRSTQTAPEPENHSLIWSLAKHAFAAKEETRSVPNTESDPHVQELFGLYELLEAREPEAQKIREWSKYCL